MGRRDRWTDRQLYAEREKRKRIHPAWRGIGCLLVVIFGVAAYFGAGMFIESGIVYLPPELRLALAPPLPIDAVIRGVVAFLFMLICFAVVNVVYAITFPHVPSEFDAPPARRDKRKRRKRH